MQITVTIPDVLEVSARKQSVTLDLTKVPANKLAGCLVLGARQKLVNFAASALHSAALAGVGNKSEGMADAEYDKRIAAWKGNEGNAGAADAEAARMLADGVEWFLKEGDWTAERASGESVDNAAANWVIVTYGDALAKMIPEMAKPKLTVSDKRSLVNAWLDAKEGRRAAIGDKMKAERESLSDL